MKKTYNYSEAHPMKVQVKPGSYAERYYRGLSGLPGVMLPLPKTLHTQGTLGKSDRATTIFNFILPSGTVLNTNPSVTGNLSATKGRRIQKTIQREADSLNGLGGYHGSVHMKSQGKKVTLYYSV